MSIDRATSLARLDRQIKDLAKWVYGTKSVPGCVKSQLAEIQESLRDLWEEVEPSAFGEGRQCGTPGLVALQRKEQGR